MDQVALPDALFVSKISKVNSYAIVALLVSPRPWSLTARCASQRIFSTMSYVVVRVTSSMSGWMEQLAKIGARQAMTARWTARIFILRKYLKLQNTITGTANQVCSLTTKIPNE